MIRSPVERSVAPREPALLYCHAFETFVTLADLYATSLRCRACSHFDFNTDDRQLVNDARCLAWNTNTSDCEQLGHAGPASTATASRAMDYWPNRDFKVVPELRRACIHSEHSAARSLCAPANARPQHLGARGTPVSLAGRAVDCDRCDAGARAPACSRYAAADIADSTQVSDRGNGRRGHQSRAGVVRLLQSSALAHAADIHGPASSVRCRDGRPDFDVALPGCGARDSRTE